MRFLVSVCFFVAFLNSDIIIRGTVYDRYIETLDGVIIEYNGEKITTDSEGNFSLEKIEKLPIKILFSKEGYETKEVEVKEQEDLEVVLTEL